MDPAGQAEFIVQAFPWDGGKPTYVYYWNDVASLGPWMNGQHAFWSWSGEVAGQTNLITVDARNNLRHNATVSDPYSTPVDDLMIVNDDIDDGDAFDCRPLPGSPLLTGGDLNLLARAGVDSDFAGHPIGSAGVGHVGPYSQAVAA